MNLGSSDSWFQRGRERWLGRARTPAGVITTVLAGIATISGFTTGIDRGDPPHVVLFGSIFSFPIYWLLVWAFVAFVRNLWEAKTAPGVPAFARPVRSNGSRTMFRSDDNAGFLSDRGGFLFRRRTWFAATGCPPVEIPQGHYDAMTVRQRTSPVAVAELHPRRWWWFEGRFYWDNEGYDADDVMALVRQRDRAKERKLQHARALLTAEDEGARQRHGIPLEVRRAVWARDGGRCVECGRADVLEYDHVIPLSLGGSSTEKNLQLLCADCNRLKGAVL